MQSVESQSLSLKPVESEPNAKSPDQSDSMDSPQVKHNRIDVSQQKRGSVLIVDYNQFGSLKKKPAEPQAQTIQKKSAFGSSRSGSGSTTKSNKSRGMLIAKSAFSKPSHKASSPAIPSPRDASPSSLKFKLGINKILSFSKFKKVIAKSLTHRENAAVALRNSVKRQLAARLKVQDKTSHEFGEKITCMAMSFDGKFMIVSTQALEGSPVNKFKLGLTDTMKTDRNYSSKFSEEGPLLDPIKFDGSQNENLLQKSYDETAPLRGVSSPPLEQIGTTKNKSGPGLWIFEMERRVPEKLPLGEELTDSELEIKCLTISRSSKYVVCGWSDAVIRIYDIAKKNQSYAFKDVHKNSITSVVITTDDKYLISGSSKDRAISIHDFQKRSLKYLLKDLHTDWLINIALSSDDLKIIAGFYDGAIKIIDREKREVLQTFNVNREEDKAFTSNLNLIGTMQVTHNGKQVVVGCQDKSIRVFDLEGGKPVHIFDQVHQHRITSLIITPDDRYIVSGSFIGSLNIIDLEKLERIHTYEKAHQGMITCSQITPYSKHIVTGSEEGSLQIISLEQEELNGGIENVHKGGVDTIAISKNNQYIVSGSYDGSIAIHYLESRNFVHCIDKAHDRAIKAIKITSDNKYIFSGSDDRSIKIFEMYTWNLIYTFQSIHEDWVTSLALTTNNKFLISGSRDRSIKVLNIHTRDLIHTFFNAHEAAVNCLAITWDNRFVVSGSEDHSIKVFSLQFKRRTVSYRFEATHNGPVKCLSVTHDNKYIISGSTDKSIKIFYLEKMECLHTIHDAHKDSVNSVVISQDDKYIISASSDKCIHIYDIERRRKLYSFIDAHTEFITSVAISEDNSRIVSGSNDNSIRIFTNPYNMTTLTITEANRILPLSYFGLFIMNTFLEEETPEAKYRIITKYPDLTIYPHGLNLFHIAAIFFPNKELIKFCLESSINFSGDFYGRTPLHYLLNSDKTDFNIVNYLLENFETLIAHSTEPYKAMTDVTQDLPTILTLSPNLVVNLLKSIVVNPLSYKNEELNHFGSIPGGVSRKCVPYKSPIFTPKVRSQLLDEDGNNLLSIKIILLFKDYDPCSPEMLEMLQALEGVDNEIIFRTKAISVLIDYLWGVSKRTLYVLGLLYSTYMGFLSVYAGLRDDDRPLWLEIVLIVFGGSFLAYKSFQLASSGIKLYFADLWNLVEITGGIMMVTTIIATWSSVSDISRQWLMTITLVLGYARWISFFRIIDETRKLIRIIIEILKDMRSFLAIVIIAILGFSIIFYQFDDDTIYSDRLLLTYNLLYAQFDIDDFNASQIFYLIVITILLSVVFLNLLVAIMSSTFQRVQESSLLADSKEKIVLTLETVALKRLFKRLGSFCKRRRDFESLHNLDFLLHTNPLKGYLFFVENSNSYNEEEAGESEWEQRIVAIKKIVRGEMEKENEGVQARIAGMEEHISKHEQKLVGLRKSLGEKLNEIESNVNHVLHLIQQQRK